MIPQKDGDLDNKLFLLQEINFFLLLACFSYLLRSFRKVEEFSLNTDLGFQNTVRCYLYKTHKKRKKFRTNTCEQKYTV